jgi:hypothetical protein
MADPLSVNLPVSSSDRSETSAQKSTETRTENVFQMALTDEEKDFIAKGIHNFGFRKEECYDEVASQDLKRELKNALRVIGSDSLLPDSVIDMKIDTAVLPLGQKRTFWLKRLIGKTTGDTQRLLRGLEKVNMFLRNYGQARRKPPIPPKKITIPIEKFHELEEKASTLNLHVQTTENKSENKDEPRPEPKMETKSEPRHEKEDKRKDTQHESNSESEMASTKLSAKSLSSKHTNSDKKRRHQPDHEDSSENEDDEDQVSSEEDSDNEYKAYQRKFKKPNKAYPVKRRRKYEDEEDLYAKYQKQFQQELQIKQLQEQLQQEQQQKQRQQQLYMQQQQQIQQERQRQQQQQQQAQQQLQQPQRFDNAYVNHFLGNTRR